MRVLVIDNYDSFVYNLVQYLAQLGADPVVRRNDEVDLDELADVDGVLVSPGPGVPERAGSSIGAIRRAAGTGTPLLGVCLGHQAIGVAWGGVVERAPELLHGKTSLVHHDGAGVLAGLPDPFTATRYHSLSIRPDTVPDALEVTGRTDSGATVRPDAVVRLPGGKSVVIDAKAPLAAFLEASQAERMGEAAGVAARRREVAATDHARALRAHVDSLAAKRYWTAFTPSPELVVCFVPGESFLAAACEADPALLEHAMARRVVLATPTTLLALLRTVALTWQQEALTGSAREVFELGRELYGRLAGLGGSVEKLGRTLHRAVEDYNAMVGGLERRVLVSARRLHDLEVTDTELAAPEPLESTVRPLTAVELLDDAAEAEPRGAAQVVEQAEVGGVVRRSRRSSFGNENSRSSSAVRTSSTSA